MSASARMVVRAGMVFAVVAAFLLTGCGGGDTNATDTPDTTTSTAETQPPSTTETTSTTTTEQPPGPTVVRIRVVNASPKDGIVRAKVEQGERVVIVVSSDVDDEVHVHGYDVSRPVAAGGTVQLPFRATIPGRFEVELEERGVPIGELTVQP